MIGKVLFEYDSLPSTNVKAMEMAGRADIAEGTVVQAMHQTQGRGQMGTHWQSEPGANLTLSVILRPSFLHIDKQFYLTKMAANSVALTITSLLGINGQIKWPNDIYINGRKICGILIQNTIQGTKVTTCIVGIGLNVNQMDFPEDLPNPISLRQVGGKSWDLTHVRKDLFRSLNQHYAALRQDLHSQDHSYFQSLYKLAEPITFQLPDGSSLQGRIEGVGTKGLLRVREKNGKLHQFNFKEITYR